MSICNINSCIAGWADINYRGFKVTDDNRYQNNHLYCDKGGLLIDITAKISKTEDYTYGEIQNWCDLGVNGTRYDNRTWTGLDDYDVGADCYKSVVDNIVGQCEGLPECQFQKEAVFEIDKCPSPAGDFSEYQLSVTINCGAGGVDLLTIFSLIVIMCIALSLGATLTVDQFSQVLKTKKRAFLIGFASQFGFMPFMSWGMARAFGVSNLVATGIVLCGSAPGGSTSNLFTHWSKGNVALSIAMSSASTVAALFMLPVLVVVYIQSTFQGSGDDAVEIPFLNIVVSLFAIIIPVLVGVCIRKADIDMAKCLNCCCDKDCSKNADVGLKLHEFVESVGGILGGLALFAAAASGIRGSPELFNVMDFKRVWLIAATFQPLGGGFGLLVSKFCGLSGPDSRAVCLETGVQSYALIMALVNLSWSGCERSEVLVFVLIGTFWYVLSSTWMVMTLRAYADLMDKYFVEWAPNVDPNAKVEESTEVKKVEAAPAEKQ